MLEENNKSGRPDLWVWGTPLVLTLVIIAASGYSVSLFHTVAEFFAIVVAILMSVVAWQTHPFTRNNFLMYLGTGYFWIACVDMLHTLSYKGVSIIDIDGSNTTAQFWLVARFIEALVLLTAPLFLDSGFNRKLVFLAYAALSSGLSLLVVSGNFPDAFIDGPGLTTFKVYSEYLFISMLAISLVFLHSKRDRIETRMLRIMYASIVFTMCAEAAFTLYIDPFGISNQMGHIFKLFSFWLIFVAIIRTTLTEPFKSLARDATTYDVIPVATVVVDDENIIRQVNHEACELAATNEGELIGRKVHDVFHPQNVSSEECVLCQAVRSGKALNMYEQELGQNHRWFDYALSSLKWDKDIRGTVQVIRDISERKRTELELEKYRQNLEGLVDERTKELAITRDKALTATQAKSSFLAHMSHELRTPLNSIIGFTGVLKEQMSGPLNEIQARQLSMVDDSARHLLNLINGILDLSKIEAGKYELIISQFSLNDVLTELCAQGEALITGKNIRLERVNPVPDLELNTDKEKLFQILLNLLGNAVKFTDEGKISLEVSEQNDYLRICVRDTGIGIAAENLSTIFNSFEQAHQGDTRPHGGTGLGLAISQRLAELLGAQITAESEMGEGSVFCLIMPLSP